MWVRKFLPSHAPAALILFARGCVQFSPFPFFLFLTHTALCVTIQEYCTAKNLKLRNRIHVKLLFGTSKPMCLPFWERLFNLPLRTGRELLSLIAEVSEKGLDISNGQLFLHDLTGRAGNTAISMELRMKIHRCLNIYTRLLVSMPCYSLY